MVAAAAGRCTLLADVTAVLFHEQLQWIIGTLKTKLYEVPMEIHEIFGRAKSSFLVP